jgi:hypothetical protein
MSRRKKYLPFWQTKKTPKNAENFNSCPTPYYRILFQNQKQRLLHNEKWQTFGKRFLRRFLDIFCNSI